MLFWTGTSRRPVLDHLTHMAIHLRATNSAILLKQFQKTAFSLVSVLIVPTNIWNQLRCDIFEKMKKTVNKAMFMNVFFELLRNRVELTSFMVICSCFDLVERHPLLFNSIVNEHVMFWGSESINKIHFNKRLN